MVVAATMHGGRGPFLRNVEGQTWAARFDVTVGLTGGPALRLPVALEIAFDGRFVDDRLIGTVSIAEVAPVGDVVFTRVR